MQKQHFLTLYTDIRRPPSVSTQLTLDDAMVIPVIECDLILANKMPSLTTAISNVIVYISQRALSKEYLIKIKKKCRIESESDTGTGTHYAEPVTERIIDFEQSKMEHWHGVR